MLPLQRNFAQSGYTDFAQHSLLPLILLLMSPNWVLKFFLKKIFSHPPDEFQVNLSFIIGNKNIFQKIFCSSEKEIAKEIYSDFYQTCGRIKAPSDSILKMMRLFYSKNVFYLKLIKQFQFRLYLDTKGVRVVNGSFT